MKKFFLPIFFSLVFGVCYGQTSVDTTKVKHGTFSTYGELRKLQADKKLNNFHYLDSTYNFDVEIPAWLTLHETGSRTFFGGTLPAVDGIENVIMIKIFDKSKFGSQTAFKDYVIGDWKFGTHPKWSAEHVCYGLKELGNIANVGEAYRASNYWRNHIYTCTYVLVETKTAFLWIDFTATPTTYEVNEPKFEEFLKGFKTTNF